MKNFSKVMRIEFCSVFGERCLSLIFFPAKKMEAYDMYGDKIEHGEVNASDRIHFDYDNKHRWPVWVQKRYHL